MKYVKGFFHGVAMMFFLFWGFLSVIGVLIHLGYGAPLPGNLDELILMVLGYVGAVAAWPLSRRPARLWEEAMAQGPASRAALVGCDSLSEEE